MSQPTVFTFEVSFCADTADASILNAESEDALLPTHLLRD